MEGSVRFRSRQKELTRLIRSFGSFLSLATVRRNGNDTSLRCEIDAANVECFSFAAVSFAPGDLLSISYLGEAQAPNTRVLFSLEYEGGS